MMGSSRHGESDDKENEDDSNAQEDSDGNEDEQREVTVARPPGLLQTTRAPQSAKALLTDIKTDNEPKLSRVLNSPKQNA